MHHELRVAGQHGAVRLDVDLAFSAPWTVIFGPSGSGKSTLLRAMCGLLPGLEVRFRRRESGVWSDVAALPVHERGIAYAAQGAAVFPHLSVQENVGFALRSRGLRDAVAVDEAVELFVLGGVLERRPRELSGGEQQRVSLARAFAVPGAKLILLDEPFTGVDRRMRDGMLERMRERSERLGVPVVSVTHDVEEALRLEAEVVRLEAGRVMARGAARNVLYEERERMREVIG
ncbi:ATP-binding cassette domain-containing protein [Granulicella sp. 5B5]|uniref:ATP-binding cassette domain-containing protein n=1 Tax=Granulicella sp. 5B5 TaxID=1617967 RepID=UPI002102458F|nr:ATP-binding cassette domain-containing protein [Granulicella sp. 5B5]